MVFTSLPIFLDPPNWNQMNINPPSSSNEQIISPPSMITGNQPPQNPNPNPNRNPRPGFMSERARLAKIPQPEPALKCPRCDSTNTKFCYFNNYSLSQPRHFCKTCRRYWTRGGALRSVPVGGGFRRNKRSSKKLQGGSGTNSSSASNSSCSSTAATTSGGTVIPSTLIAANPQLNFLSSLHPFGDLGLNFTAMGQPMDGGGHFQMGMQQQYPFLGGISYPNFNGEGSTIGGVSELGLGFHLPVRVGSSANICSGLITQMASVKMEDGARNNGLSRQYLGMASGNDQYFEGGWAGDLSGFNSPPTGNML